MALTADRVKETTTTTGTGTITLAGAVSQFQAFSDAFDTNDEIMYAIVGQTGTQWEVGIGTLLSSTTLRRDTVRDSSNSGSLVSFSAGTKNVFATIAAEDFMDLVAGAGITSLNGLTGATQTFATPGTSGIDIAWVSSGTAHTLNVPTASATNRGAVSNTDWSAFNAKVATTRTVSTTSPLAGGGDLSANRTLTVGGLSSLGTANYVLGSNAGASAWEYKQLIEGSNITITHGVGTITITGAAGGITTFNTLTGAAQTLAVDTTGPIGWTSSGTVHTLNMPTASGSVRGVLSTSDWTTFNNKVTSLTGGTGIGITGTTTVPIVTLANTAVTPASYTYSSITVDAQGRITAASSGTAPSDTGVTTVASFSASSQTNGAAISGGSSNIITFGPVDTTNPGMLTAAQYKFLLASSICRRV